jgi:hypothetical protein
MKEQERQEIIECLVFQGEQFEKDKPRLMELIDILKKVNCKSDFSDLQIIDQQKLIKECCDVLGYETTIANNASRQPNYVEKRRAIAYFVFMAYDEQPNIFNVLGRYFDKDRASFNHHVNKAKVLHRINDRIFNNYLETLKNHNFNDNRNYQTTQTNGCHNLVS